jgi:ribosomal protein L9
MKVAPERLEMSPITQIGPHSVTVHVDAQTVRALQVDVLPAN